MASNEETKDFSKANDVPNLSEVLKSLGKMICHEMTKVVMSEEFKLSVAGKMQSSKETSATFVAESFSSLKKQLVKVEAKLEAIENNLYNMEQRNLDRKKALIRQILENTVKEMGQEVTSSLSTKDVSTQVNLPSPVYDTIVLLDPPIGEAFILSDGSSSTTSSTLSLEKATDIEICEYYEIMEKFNEPKIRRSVSEGTLI